MLINVHCPIFKKKINILDITVKGITFKRILPSTYRQRRTKLTLSFYIWSRSAGADVREQIACPFVVALCPSTCSSDGRRGTVMNVRVVGK